MNNLVLPPFRPQGGLPEVSLGSRLHSITPAALKEEALLPRFSDTGASYQFLNSTLFTPPVRGSPRAAVLSLQCAPHPIWF